MRELEKERVRELLESSGSKENKKERMYCVVGIRVWKGASGIKWWVYVCGGQNAREKRKEKERYGWKKRQRIRNHRLKIIPQYFHNKF